MCAFFMSNFIHSSHEVGRKRVLALGVALLSGGCRIVFMFLFWLAKFNSLVGQMIQLTSRYLTTDQH